MRVRRRRTETTFDGQGLPCQSGVKILTFVLVARALRFEPNGHCCWPALWSRRWLEEEQPAGEAEGPQAEGFGPRRGLLQLPQIFGEPDRLKRETEPGIRHKPDIPGQQASIRPRIQGKSSTAYLYFRTKAVQDL